MAIILRLDRMMADRKMSLNELAEKVGISNVNLSNIKTGKICAIRFSTLNGICKALRCQPGDILEYIEDDEYVEVTPLNLRLRKKYLTSLERRRIRGKMLKAEGAAE